MNTLGGTGLWDETDGFYYDQLHVDGTTLPLRVRSVVGLIPLFAVEVLDDDDIDRLPGFRKRMDWFLENRQDLCAADFLHGAGRLDGHTQRLLAIPSLGRLLRVLRYVLDENEFLSPYGIRSLSKFHQRAPLHAADRRRRAAGGLRAGRIDQRHCSAAIPTGAGRSGFRSTTC